MDILTTLRTQWDRALAVAAAIAGFVCLVVGYFGVSGTGFVAEQLPYVVGDGLIGLFLLGAAATLWLSADLRDEWRKLDMIDDKLGRAFGDAEPAEPAVALPEAPPAAEIGAPRRVRGQDAAEAPAAEAPAAKAPARKAPATKASAKRPAARTRGAER